MTLTGRVNEALQNIDVLYNCHYEFKLMIYIWKTYLSFSTAVYPEGQYFFTAAKDGSIKVHCNLFCIRANMNMN